MSNYPPGVTGNEWQIAGVPEGTQEVECRNKDATLRILSNTIDGEYIGEGMECPYNGPADGYYTEYRTFIWDCPLCEKENEEEFD